MKKIFYALMVLGLILSASLVCFAANDASVTIDGKAVKFSADSGTPFIDQNNRTQVPLRLTMETAGCDVEWDDVTRTAIVNKGDVDVEVPIGKSYILVNGEYIQNDTVAVIIDNRTYLPIRAALEAIGCSVSWDQDTKTVIVDTDPEYVTAKDYGTSTYKGQSFGECYYERLVMKGNDAVSQKINDYFKEKSVEFLADDGQSFYNTGSTDIDAGMTQGFLYSCTSRVDGVYITEKYISVRTEEFWYCGGVANTNYKGHTFDAKMGEVLNVVALFDGDADKAEKTIKQACLDYINENEELFHDNAAERIAEYDVKDFKFYMDHGLYIILDTYELSPGSSGPQIIPVKGF